MTESERKDRWAVDFAKAFGFAGDRWQMLKTWMAKLPHLTSYELEQGTQLLFERISQASTDLPLAHDKKLELLIHCLREAEAIEANSIRDSWQREAQENSVDCQLCNGMGYVVVPKHVVDGRWVPLRGWGYYTASVTCRCPRGRYFQQLSESKTSLDVYEQLCPRWQAELKRVQDERSAAQGLTPTPGTAPYDEALERIRQRAEQMREAEECGRSPF